MIYMMEYSDELKGKIKEVRDFENFKDKLMHKLENFQKAYNELSEFFEQEEKFDCNDFICDDYPFEKSFDEIQVSDWVYTVEEKLESKLEQLTNEKYEAIKKEARSR